MTLLSAWALAGLVLLAPLIALHLRRERPPLRDVASLLTWRELGAEAPARRRRFGPPLLPLLLALQVAALVLLVVALARPADPSEAASGARVYVLDGSEWMLAREGGRSRLDRAREVVRQGLDATSADTDVHVVVAGTQPLLLHSGGPEGARRAVASAAADASEADVDGALRLAAGLRTEATDRVILIRAPETDPPRVTAAPETFSQRVVGRPVTDRAIAWTAARCGLPGPSRCEIFARIDGAGGAPALDRVIVRRDGRVESAQPVRVGPGQSVPVAFEAPSGAELELRLARGGALAANDRARVSVPGGSATRITLVADPERALPLARAFAAVPGARLSVRAPDDYRDADARNSDLLVLYRSLPGGALPPAPALFLVDPPSLPGGSSEPELADPRLSGSDPTSPLLAEVDLTALAIDPGRGRRLELPDWMTPVAWSPSGPLLAAGTSEDRRVAVLGFDPNGSTLPQLASFPILAANLVDWADGRDIGGGDRSAAGASDLVSGAGEGAGPPIDLTAAPLAASAADPAPRWSWLLAVALAVLVAEWLYALKRRPRFEGR